MADISNAFDKRARSLQQVNPVAMTFVERVGQQTMEQVFQPFPCLEINKYQSLNPVSRAAF